MDLCLGGPVWHASASATTQATAQWMALQALDGVGDKAAGEWHEARERAYHIRRRMTQDEMSMGKIELRDVRGTHEAAQRVERIVRVVPQVKRLAMEEIGA